MTTAPAYFCRFRRRVRPRTLHTISDVDLAPIRALIPGTPGDPGALANNYRAFINAVLWVAKSGAHSRNDCSICAGDIRSTCYSTVFGNFGALALPLHPVYGVSQSALFVFRDFSRLSPFPGRLDRCVFGRQGISDYRGISPISAISIQHKQ